MSCDCVYLPYHTILFVTHTCIICYVKLWGGGAPFTYNDKKNECVDVRGTHVKLLGDIPSIWDEVGEWGTDSMVAIASRTDEPTWAREILGKFRSAKGKLLIDIVHPDLIEM
jgi:hypothetical protein